LRVKERGNTRLVKVLGRIPLGQNWGNSKLKGGRREKENLKKKRAATRGRGGNKQGKLKS